jgi:metallo-beta-lactamase class B
LLDANNQDIRREITNFSTYVAGGDSHTILGRPEFYSYTVGEHSVRDWVTELALGQPVADVSCIDCRLPDFVGYDTPDSLKDLWMSWESPDQRVDAFRIFDNIAYIGIEWVAAYVIETSEGLILIDSLYGNWVRELPAKFEQLGLDPGDIKYVIVTHGHFDHAGGAADFQRRYNAKIVMTEEDWALAAGPADHPLFAFPAPRRDIVAKDGDVIELGDTRIELFKTPGHTEGVLSLRYQVRDGDNTHTAVTLGGVGLNFSGVERTGQYIDSYERLQSMQEGVEVSLPNHPAMARVFERRDRLHSRNPGDRHPFVDARAYQANLAMFLERAREKLEKEQAGTADEPMAELQKAISN